MSNCNCPSVFRPGKIGNIEIRNRAVMPSMGLSATPGGYINEVLIRHYVERAKIVLQISHTGRGAKREIIGDQPVGPSPVALEMMAVIGIERETPRELTIEEIKAIEDRYAEGALRAKKAGFDGVEIHCTGYLWRKPENPVYRRRRYPHQRGRGGLHAGRMRFYAVALKI